MAELFTLDNGLAFLALTALEIVLGIDNIIFIAILAGRLEPSRRDRARTLGLLVSVVSRVILLLGIGVVISLERPLFTIAGLGITGKDLVLICGGAFLVGKATVELHHKVHKETDESVKSLAQPSMGSILFQVLTIGMIFSLDSVITAVGFTKEVPIMIAAVLASCGVMLWCSGPVVRFIERHPTIKVLALSFLLLIGTLLVAEGFHQHINKGSIYFAMAFAFGVDMLQLWTLVPDIPDRMPKQNGA